jgi:hypothetical protein
MVYDIPIYTLWLPKYVYKHITDILFPINVVIIETKGYMIIK